MSSAEVDAFLDELASPLTPALRTLRELILDVDPRVREEIKWNSPSFAITDHFATTNLRPNGPLLLVLHAGAKKSGRELRDAVSDPGGLLDWKSGERALLSFDDVSAVEGAHSALQLLVRDWIAATQ